MGTMNNSIKNKKENLTKDEINVLEKIAQHSKMDCWFMVNETGTGIYDIENDECLSLYRGIDELNQGIVDIHNDYNLSEKEIELYQNLILRLNID